MSDVQFKHEFLMNQTTWSTSIRHRCRVAVEMKRSIRRCSVKVLVLLVAAEFYSGIISADELFTRGGSIDPAEREILPVDEAFRFGSFMETDGVRIFWQITPGYFLYRDKFAFRTESGELDIELEEGEWYQDETFGKVQVLEGLVEVYVEASQELVSIHYQGCAARGFCYPPQERLLTSPK